MFKVRGATVYPSEVEAALRGVTGVRQAFVTDVRGPAGNRWAPWWCHALAPDDLDRAVRSS